MPYWTDIFDNDELDFYAKGVFVLLSKYANGEGKCWPSLATLSARTGLSRPTIRKALTNLVDHGHLSITKRKTECGDSDSNLYRLRVVNNIDHVVNDIDHVGNDVSEGGQGDLLRVGNDVSPNLSNKNLPNELYTSPLPSGKRKEKEYRYTQEHLAVAELLRRLIRQRKPDFRFAGKIESWADTIRLMDEQDNRHVERIKAVIEWSQRDHFWQNNILSAATLRKQFDRLELKMQSGKTVPGASGRDILEKIARGETYDKRTDGEAIDIDGHRVS